MSAENLSNEPVVCTPEQYERSNNSSDLSIHCLTRGQSIGLTIVAESGLISLLAVVFVFFIIARNVIRRIQRVKGGRWLLLAEPVDILMLSLFFADLFQALGAVMDINWINKGRVEVGPFCTAQGVIQQFGETGVAISTLVIAVYTFIGIWWGKGKGAVLVTKIVIAIVWLFIILMVIIGNVTHRKKDQFYQSPTPYWCWIGEDYLQLRIWGEYIWLWVTLFFSVFSYILVYFWSRNNITRNVEDPWWKLKIHASNSTSDLSLRPRQALGMLAYPAVYCIVILPFSIVRWIGFVQERGNQPSNIPSAATLAVAAIYGLSGACNVVLLLMTRPSTVIFGRTASDSDYTASRAPSPDMDGHIAYELGGSRNGDVGLGRLPSR